MQLKFKFVYKHEDGRCLISSAYNLLDLLNIVEDDIYCSLSPCNCQPIGETNVIECNCDAELDGFTLFKIIQFTGLKDKHDTEIYQDDIVECIGYDGKGYSKTVVTFEINSPCESEFTIGSMGWYQEEIEVIGNINVNTNN